MMTPSGWCQVLVSCVSWIASSGWLITFPRLPVSRTPWMPATNAERALAVKVVSVWFSWTVENVVVCDPTLIWLGLPLASTAGTRVA
jgi:hypothetical protein